MQELEGESLDKLCREYIDAGTPVLLWATIAMEAPVESTQFSWRTAASCSPGCIPSTACC